MSLDFILDLSMQIGKCMSHVKARDEVRRFFNMKRETKAFQNAFQTKLLDRKIKTFTITKKALIDI